VFGKKQKYEALLERAEANRSLLDSTNPDYMKMAAREIRDAWSDAGYPEGDAIELARELERRADQIKRQPFVDRVKRPCVWCSGRLFRISDEQSLEGMDVRVRLIGCEGCGAISMFSTTPKALTAWGHVVSVDDTGPYR
jgi:hypothetical protein